MTGTGIMVPRSVLVHCWTLILSCVIIVATLHSSCYCSRVISVTSDGDNNGCLSNDSQPCRTLDHAVSTLYENDTTIEVLYSHEFKNISRISSSARNLSIIGKQNLTTIVITCSERGYGLVFSHQTNITISGISWINCSAIHNSTAMSDELFDDKNLIPMYSGLLFHNITDLTIESCTFSTDWGVGLTLFDVGGSVNILNSHFINNSIKYEYQCTNTSKASIFSDNPCSSLGGGLYIELTRCGFTTDCPRNPTVVPNTLYIIDNCTFKSNDKPAAFTQSPDIVLGLKNTWWPFGLGGGMSLCIRGANSDNSFKINNSRFENNTALGGAGINLIMCDNVQNNTVVISDVWFVANEAKTFFGGGIRTIQHPNQSGVIHFNRVMFVNNSAISGGAGDHGITIGYDGYDYSISDEVSTVYFEDCEWHNNTATKAGAALQCLNLHVTTTVARAIMHFNNSLFCGNAIPRPQAHTVRYGQGAIYALGVQIEFVGRTVITRSIGTAVVVSSTQLILEGEVLIHYNQGLKGSGLYLEGLSWILLKKGLNLTFHHNDAFEAGAALYYVYNPSRAFNISKTCFIRYEDPAAPPSDWDVNVTFSENRAGVGGNALFLTDPPDCYWIKDGFLFDTNSKIFHFQDNPTPVMSTLVHNITFNSSDVSAPVDGYYMVDVMPGSQLSIPVIIVDYFNSTDTVATVDTKCFNFTLFKQNHFFRDVCTHESDFRFSGSRVLTINTSLTGFRLGGPENNSELMLTFKTLEAQPLLFDLRIHFTSCKNGYIYNNDTKFCDCYGDNPGFARCFAAMDKDITIEKPCVRRGYWIGKVPSKKPPNDEVYIEACCTSSYCRIDCDEHCMNLEGWCMVPEDSSKLCVNHHSGPLCALCETDYCLGYDGMLCIPRKDCNTKSSILLIFSIVVFWVVIIIALLLILRLHLQIGSGYIYGFVYYFSVLPHFLTVNLQNTWFSTFVSIFQGVSRLNPEFLSYTSLCFDSEWNLTQIHATFFNYFHPLTIGIIIYLLLQANRRCFRSIFTQSSPIHILGIILLLSYTSLFQTSINLIVPIQFKQLNPSTYVKIQPNTPYGDPIQHLPYLLVAILVESLLVIPFAFILLLAPWLMRFSRLQRLTWLKHLVDEYQACYRSKYRWFAGYYLICRQLVALTVAVFRDHSNVIIAQQVLNTTILLVHAYIQPYKERWLNVLDTVFLFDLTLLTFFNNPVSIDESIYPEEIMYVLQYLLILIPCIYFVVACTVILGLRIRLCYNERRQKVRWGEFRRQSEAINTQTQQAAEDYDEIDGATLSVEMSTHTRQMLGARSTRRLITVTDRTQQSQSRASSGASASMDGSVTDSEDNMLIPPSPSTPKLIKRVMSSLGSQVQFWRGRTYSQRSVNERHLSDTSESLEYDRSTSTS